MRFKFFLCALLLGLSLPFISLKAQTIDPGSLKVSQMSDAQILEIYKKFEEAGLSEGEAIRQLVQRGLDPSEAENFKIRLQEIQTGGKTGKSGSQSALGKENKINYSRDTSLITAPKPVSKPSRIYGAEIFSNPNLKFEPNIRIATPKNYVLGPDDEINFILTGLNERSVSSKVTPEGNLRIPSVGIVYVNGLTIEQAYSKIKNKTRVFYPALASGQTKLTVTLGNVRSIRVIIMGEVVQPGTYTISSLSSLFNALYESGGPKTNGSLRNIEVIRGNKVVQTVDLYAFLQHGYMDENVRLEDQDVIRVPPYVTRVAIEGAIKRSGLYELKQGETLTDLIRYSGGLGDMAYKGMAKVMQVGEKERSVKDIPADLFDRYTLKNADSVYFGTILNRYSNRVNIEGAVYRPGPFELTEGLTLMGLIRKADGLREDASLKNGYIKRTNPNLDKEMLPFSLSQVLSGAQSDIPLLREDSVVIVSQQELKDQLTITIGGNVRAPGTFIYRKGMSVADALIMANGFTYDAAAHRVEISRLVRDDSDVLSNNLITVIPVNLDSASLSKEGALLLEPLNYIYVPRLVNSRSLGNVKVRGEVLFPGDYPLQRRDETGAEFIERAGGLTPIGSLENAQVYRSGTRVDISLSELDPKKINSTILMEGDSVYIPRQKPFVEVAGAVNTPQLLRYVSKNFRYYINAAGGTTENARLKNAYVQYPNGTNQPVKKFLFFKNYPPVTAGSKIIVPENKAPKIKLGVGEVTGIASALTALITVIAILVK